MSPAELPISTESSITTASVALLTFGGAGSVSVCFSTINCSSADHFLERVGISLQNQQVVFEEDPMPGGHVAVPLLADAGGDGDVVLAERLQVADGLADQRRAGRQQCLGRVIGDLEWALARAAGPLARQQAPSDAEKDDADQRQTGADRQVVEHSERLAGDVTAHSRDDDVGGGADQRCELA